MEYIAYLHKEANSDYGVSFPDFPGCITAGATLEEARSMAAEALSVHIAGMRDDGEAIPEPSTLDDLRRDPALKNAVAFLVSISEPEKTVRFNVTARESQLGEIDSRARAARLTRSAFLVQSALGRKSPTSSRSSRTLSKSRRRKSA